MLWILKDVLLLAITAVEPVEDAGPGGLAVYLSDCVQEREVLGAGVLAELGVSAFRDAADAFHDLDSILRLHFAGFVNVEESDLCDDVRSHEFGSGVYLRACLHAASASHASGELVCP